MLMFRRCLRHAMPLRAGSHYATRRCYLIIFLFSTPCRCRLLMPLFAIISLFFADIFRDDAAFAADIFFDDVSSLSLHFSDAADDYFLC